jgi:UDP-N-acetylmuramoyl-tripeptide--D-alanyl-D-alanine ligase
MKLALCRKLPHMYNIGFHDFKKLQDAIFINFEKLGSDFTEIKGISTDSRTIQPGEVFWALVGESFDGHAFLRTAAEKKAKFAVVQAGKAEFSEIENFGLVTVPDTLKALQQLGHIQRMKYDIPVIAVTGSNGKTTVKEMTHHILSSKMNVHKTEGNFNNHIGCPLTLLKLLPEHQAAVIELGMNHVGEIAALSEIASPNQAVVTDVSGAHLEFFGSIEAIAREKLSLFDCLPAGSTIYKNLDNPYTAAYHNSELDEITFSSEKEADVIGKINSVDQAGCANFTLNDKVDIQLQISGVHNVKNALAAAAVAIKLGLSEAEIRDALENFQAYSKRMQIIQWNDVTIINDAYNANPSSMKAAFDTVKRMIKRGKLILALGSMFELGNKSLDMHREVLKEALDLQPVSICVMGSDFEKAAETMKDKTQTLILTFKDHEALSQRLRSELSDGDILLVKGSRGMTMEKVLQYLTGNSLN